MLSPPLYCGNMIFLLKIGLSGGLNGRARQGYIAKIMPISRRDLFFGLCNLVGGVGSSGGCGGGDWPVHALAPLAQDAEADRRLTLG